eukprot:436392_1
MGCGFETVDNTQRTGTGVYHNNSINECVAVQSTFDSNGVTAVARCCDAPAGITVICDPIKDESVAATNAGDKISNVCDTGAGYVLTSCSVSAETGVTNSLFQGCYPGGVSEAYTENTIGVSIYNNECTVQKGSSGGSGIKAIPSLTCCRSPQALLSCYRTFSAKATGEGTEASVECGAGYIMVSCSGIGQDPTGDVNSWLVKSDGKCYARTSDATAVVATGICCQFNTFNPTAIPTVNPTTTPTAIPTANPATSNPTTIPTVNPTASTKHPTASTKHPTYDPTKYPTLYPTKYPSKSPTNNPSNNPSISPSKYPTKYPTLHPTKYPSKSPTKNPSESPTKNPTYDPSTSPTFDPTVNPTFYPTPKPTYKPTPRPIFGTPTQTPIVPTSDSPTESPTDSVPFPEEAVFIGLGVVGGLGAFMLLVGILQFCVEKKEREKTKDKLSKQIDIDQDGRVDADTNVSGFMLLPQTDNDDDEKEEEEQDEENQAMLEFEMEAQQEVEMMEQGVD